MSDKLVRQLFKVVTMSGAHSFFLQTKLYCKNMISVQCVVSYVERYRKMVCRTLLSFIEKLRDIVASNQFTVNKHISFFPPWNW